MRQDRSFRLLTLSHLYQVLLPSPRNSAWMNASLLQQTQCRHFLYAPEVETIVKPLLEHQADLRVYKIGALSDMTKPDTPHYAYDKEYDASKWDPILILHSSGSTGPPKPIVMNHATFAVGDNDRNLPTIPGRVNQNWSLWDFAQQETFFSPFPAFHLAGFSSMVMLPIYYQNAKLVMSPPTRPPTGHLVSEIMDQFELKSVFCPPVIAEQLVQESGAIEKCKRLNFLLYAGGPLSQNAGEALSKVTDVCQFYGQTETGGIQALVPRRENWASLEWNPLQEAIMELYGDDIYEFTMKRNPALEKIRSLSANFPDAEVWHTKDLFKRHPTNPDLWTFHGRVDDIIVLSNGEKFNPVPSELHISAHSLLSGALIIGQGHPQPCLILEPKDPDQKLESLVDAVWPSIEEANSRAPGQARITRDMILITFPSRPFVRSGKGTVVRASTGQQYNDEIAELFSRDISKNLERIALSSPVDQAAATKFVSQVMASAFPGHQLQPNDDLFSLGLDSLQALEVIKLLKAGIRAADTTTDISWVSMKYLYLHSSIAEISHAVTSACSGDSKGAEKTQTSDDDATRGRAQKMQAILDRYTKDLPSPPSGARQPHAVPKANVILTGSTGSLGIQLLARLLSDPNVAQISCFDRSANARERIEKALAAWSPPPSIDPSRVSFHQADYKAADFGLPPAVLAGLRKTVTTIIHNAWKVDFNHSLDTFEDVHIRGVRNLVDFSASSALRPRIVFVSSVSSVGEWRRLDPAVSSIPESLPPSLDASMSTGYGESKAVAEHLLAAAAENSGIDVSILRVGQIAGPARPGNGARWNDSEWFPLLLRTARALGKIPDARALGDVDWIPADLLASIVWELSGGPTTTVADAGDAGEEEEEERGSLRIFHVVNPVPRPWAEMQPVVKAELGKTGHPVEDVSMGDWVAELESSTDLDDKEAVEARPAVKILEFFRAVGEKEGVVVGKGSSFATDRARESSGTIRDLSPVSDEWLRKWLGDWGF